MMHIIMNKKEYLLQKEQEVTSTILLIFILVTSIAYGQSSTINNDYQIIKSVMNNYKANELIISTDNDNSYAISIIKNEEMKEQKEHTIDNMSINPTIEFDSDSITLKIFNTREYGHLLSQESKSKWKIDGKIITKSNTQNDTHVTKRKIWIGKPIYVKSNKLALVSIRTDNWIGLSIYIKDEKEWREYKLIAPKQISKKATKY